jgi:hypothetical protein
MSRGCRIHADCPANRERECYKRWCQEIGMRPNIRQDGKQETATRKSSRSNGKDQHRRRNVRPRFALRGHQPEVRHHRLFRDSHNAETDRTLRFKRTVERRDTSVSRETASEGPSPAQLTELRLLYTMTRSRGFPRRRTGSRNRRFRDVSATVANSLPLRSGSESDACACTASPARAPSSLPSSSCRSARRP